MGDTRFIGGSRRARDRRRFDWYVYATEWTVKVPAHMTIGDVRVGITRAIEDYLRQNALESGLSTSYRVRSVQDPYDVPPPMLTPAGLVRDELDRGGLRGVQDLVHGVARAAARCIPALRRRVRRKRHDR